MSTPDPVAASLAAGQVVHAGAQLDVWLRDGSKVSTLIGSAQGDADESRAWRHEGSVVVPGSVDERAMQIGLRARLRTSMVGSDGRTYWAPLVTGSITARSRSLGGAAWRVTLRSPEWRIARAGFTTKRTLAGSAFNAAAVLVAEAMPGRRVYVDPRLQDIPLSAREYEPGDDTRLRAIQDVAAACGAVFYATPGGTLTLAPPVTVKGPADWTVEAGVGLVSAGADVDEERYANIIVVTNTDGDRDVRGLEWARPGQAGYVGDVAAGVLTGSHGATGDEVGRGMYVRHYSLPVTDDTDAWAAAKAILDGMPREVARIDFTGIDNPWISAGSRIHVRGPGVTSRHVVTRRQWSVPSTPMTCDTRR